MDGTTATGLFYTETAVRQALGGERGAERGVMLAKGGGLALWGRREGGSLVSGPLAEHYVIGSGVAHGLGWRR